MTASDRAFIKAYFQDEAESVPPPPHVGLPNREPVERQENGFSSYELRDSDGESDPYAPEPWAVDASQEASFYSDNQASVPIREVASGQPGEVTEFVPRPHFPLAPATSHGAPDRKRSEIRLERNEISDSPVERKPLSSFSQETQVVEEFSPALEVDAFRWSSRSEELLAKKGEAWNAVAECLLQQQAAQDKKLFAVASCWREEGRTTALLCLAHVLAQHTRSSGQLGPALVDADFFQPELAANLGLALQTGWEDVLRGEISLAEAVVASKNDGAILLPLRSNIQQPLPLCKNLLAPVSLQVLRDNASIVLVDLGPVLDQESGQAALTLVKETGIEGTILVRDHAHTSADEMAAAREQLTSAGAPVMGIIENFCPNPAEVKQALPFTAGAGTELTA